MKLSVKVKPGSKEDSCKKGSDGSYTLRVRARAHDGKANDAVIAVLAGHFGVARSRIMILKGVASRNKLISLS